MSSGGVRRHSKPSLRVLDALASESERDPLATTETLYDVIDPDALDAIIEHAQEHPASSDVTVVFEFAGYRVSIDGSQEITLTPLN